jgi:hypothetical protein
MDTPTPTNGKHDVITHRVLVCSMAAVVLLSGAGSCLLAALGVETPHSLSALGYTAVGALSGMLVSIMKGNSS